MAFFISYPKETKIFYIVVLIFIILFHFLKIEILFILSLILFVILFYFCLVWTERRPLLQAENVWGALIISFLWFLKFLLATTIGIIIIFFLREYFPDMREYFLEPLT